MNGRALGTIEIGDWRLGDGRVVDVGWIAALLGIRWVAVLHPCQKGLTQAAVEQLGQGVQLSLGGGERAQHVNDRSRAPKVFDTIV